MDCALVSARRLALLATTALVFSSVVASAQEPTTVLDRLTIEAESDETLTQDGYVAERGRLGTKVDTDIIDIPQAISTVTQDQIEDQEPRTLNEALSYTASANPNNFGFDSRYDAFTLRGFPAYYNGIFRDGLRQYNGPSAWFKTEPYGIEGLTILKGPASSLYGVSGPGGIVNIVTKRPKEELFREVEILGGNHRRAQTAFDFSGPANEEGTILYRFTGLGRVADTELPGYSDDKVYFAPALTFQPTDDTKLTLLGEYSRAVTGATAFFYNPSYGEVSDLYAGDSEWNEFTGEQGRIGYELEHRFNDLLTVRQNLRYHKIDADLKYSGFYPAPPDRSWGHYVEDAENFVVDNMAELSFDTGPINHTALLGFDYGWASYDAAAASSLVSPSELEGADLAFSGSQEMDQYGIYAQDQIWLDKWTLFLSGRYDWVDSTSTDYLSVTTEQEDSAFSGRVGLSYHTDWGVVPYANYSTSFAPNLGFVYDYATDTRRVAEPTRGEQIEVGVKYQVPNSNAVLTAAYFDITQEDGTVLDGTFDDAGNQRQRQLDLRSRGIELEANASLDNGLGIIASYTYMEMEIEKGVAGTEGNELSATPNHIFSLWGHYDVQSGPFIGLGLGAGVRYVGESYGDDANTFKNEDRAFLDASISYDFGARNPDFDGLLLQVNAKNLIDEKKPICTTGNCYLDEGRSIFASMRYRF